MPVQSRFHQLPKVFPNVDDAVKVDVEPVLSLKEDSVVADRLCCEKLELLDCKVLVLLKLALRSFVRSFVVAWQLADFAPVGGRLVKLVSLVTEVLTVLIN
ncbi:hypothetical protein EVAR_72833_1 [Eumeta japonica]|uniref:Uncharacterized protein n=1 Tax=Eumeta variegata TaxID=151549 RepID=A0A4C1TAT2_EUMVA|nr:hypothetical protein EVAR_72833_1 [Eumeta japonica]